MFEIQLLWHRISHAVILISKDCSLILVLKKNDKYWRVLWSFCALEGRYICDFLGFCCKLLPWVSLISHQQHETISTEQILCQILSGASGHESKCQNPHRAMEDSAEWSANRNYCFNFAAKIIKSILGAYMYRNTL